MLAKEKNRICIVTEDILEPIDEGFKKTIFEICCALKRHRSTAVFGRNITERLGISIQCNRFYIAQEIFKRIRSLRPEAVIYLSMSSLTLASFIRAKVLTLFARVPVVVVGLQPRDLPEWARVFVRLFLKPSLVLVQSRRSLEYCRTLGLHCEVLPSGVDLIRFVPVDRERKRQLRQQYGVPLARPILLHVGHLRRGRGLEDVTPLTGDRFLPVVVTSSSTSRDEDLNLELERAGVLLWSKYVERIEHFYQMADAYLFPTRNSTSAIEFPLSILEALACGLPVLTTRFGGITDFCAENDTLKFYDSVEDGREKLEQLLAAGQSRPSMERFSWDSVARLILEKVDRL